MQKIKDIFYDTNDLIVAAIIIVLAAGLIWDRIGVILDYPSASGSGSVYNQNESVVTGDGETSEGPTANGDAISNEGETGDAASGDADAGTGDAGTGDATATAPGGEATPPAEPVRYSLYIAYGETGAQIAKNLLDSGLIKSDTEFYDALSAANAATRLQAGTFIITEGATPAEIVDILTGR
ncbi:MAG: endolytic transglycosylase MltG [Clostridiales Family XIII bacterium]|jgi:hypothetical protein|nr:endolytic transglycosylase MltG [Clostridiales Family XIII bacterium]